MPWLETRLHLGIQKNTTASDFNVGFISRLGCRVLRHADHSSLRCDYWKNGIDPVYVEAFCKSRLEFEKVQSTTLVCNTEAGTVAPSGLITVTCGSQRAVSTNRADPKVGATFSPERVHMTKERENRVCQMSIDKRKMRNTVRMKTSWKH